MLQRKVVLVKLLLLLLKALPTLIIKCAIVIKILTAKNVLNIRPMVRAASNGWRYYLTESNLKTARSLATNACEFLYAVFVTYDEMRPLKTHVNSSLPSRRNATGTNFWHPAPMAVESYLEHNSNAGPSPGNSTATTVLWTIALVSVIVIGLIIKRYQKDRGGTRGKYFAALF